MTTLAGLFPELEGEQVENQVETEFRSLVSKTCAEMTDLAFEIVQEKQEPLPREGHTENLRTLFTEFRQPSTSRSSNPGGADRQISDTAGKSSHRNSPSLLHLGKI